MSAPPWKAKCWGGPLDGNVVWVPARVDEMPYGWVKIEDLKIDEPHVGQALPDEQVLVDENAQGFYIHDPELGHPSGLLTFRWHDLQVSLTANTTADGEA